MTCANDNKLKLSTTHFEKDSEAKIDWVQREKLVTENEMVEWHNRPDGHETEQTHREARCAAVHGVTKSQTRVNDWTTTPILKNKLMFEIFFLISYIQFYIQVFVRSNRIWEYKWVSHWNNSSLTYTWNHFFALHLDFTLWAAHWRWEPTFPSSLWNKPCC